MGFNASILMACIGLISLRMALAYSSSVNRRTLYLATAFTAAFTLFFPILSFGPGGGVTLIALTVVLLFPYKHCLIALLKRTTRSGIKKLANKVQGKYLYNSESGFFTLTSNQDDHKIWVGNVANQISSLDNQVHIESSYHMLAFVVRIQPQNFNCSILKGWPSPRFHNSEYRSRSRLVQGSFSVTPADNEFTLERATGGNFARLDDHLTPDELNNHTGYRIFGRILNNNNSLFESLFSGELYDLLIECASHSPYYEVNITPSSINIYTTLCNYDIQKINLDFLICLSNALKTLSKNGGSNEAPCTQDAAA